MQPLVVKVTDASGKPIADKEVAWAISSTGFAGGNVRSATTLTDLNGNTSNSYDQVSIVTGGTGFSSGFAQSVITATADGQVATFFETQSLSDPNNHVRFLIEGQMISPTAPPDTPITGVAGGTIARRLR